MFAQTDWTQITLALIGLVGTCVSAYLVYLTRRLESRAAGHADRAKASEEHAASLSGAVKKKPRRRRRPPPHPDG